MDGIVGNNTKLMEKSMDFLWAKQAAILDNISNAETPNYKVKTVTFEETLQRQLEAAGASTKPKHLAAQAIENAQYRVKDANDVTRMDDNGVNVTEQNVELVRTAYQLQYTMQSISSDLNTLKSAITG